MEYQARSLRNMVLLGFQLHRTTGFRHIFQEVNIKEEAKFACCDARF